MKNSALAAMALDPDSLIVEALAERLRGEPGPACEALAQRMAARPIPAPTPTTGNAWTSYGKDSARRRDGLEVGRGFHPRIEPRKADDPAPWTVCFPPLPGGVMPVAELGRVDTLADACEEVDSRWPLPPWWLTIDRRSFVVGSCAAVRDGLCPCQRPEGHTGDHTYFPDNVSWANEELPC